MGGIPLIRKINGVQADASGNISVGTVGPQGPKGEQGPAGPQGERGPQGPSGASGKAYITQTWHSGANWYRVWSDGFIEQGGQLPHLTYDTSNTVCTFHKSFSSTPQVFRQVQTSMWQAYNMVHAALYDANRTNFKYGNTRIDASYGFWYACGY